MTPTEKTEQQLAEEACLELFDTYCDPKEAKTVFEVSGEMQRLDLESTWLDGRRSRDQELSQLKLDRSAFAEETQRYRDAWLSDQKEIAQLKEKLEICEDFNENVIAECDAQIERYRKALGYISMHAGIAADGNSTLPDKQVLRECADIAYKGERPALSEPSAAKTEGAEE